MDFYWSTYVQDPELLYKTRAVRFHDGNKASWLNLLKVKNGMDVLDVGCGSGVFCHRIKTYMPGVKITGLDFDTANIEYARAKTAELGLDCAFVNGNAVDLPFDNGTFDLCYSQSVIDFCEPNAFIKEQYRVLKPGGEIVVLCHGTGVGSETWEPTDDSEEKELYDRISAEAAKNESKQIKRYDSNVSNYFNYLHKNGFTNISIDNMAFISYAPDFYNVTYETAIEQINAERLVELSSVDKARNLAPDCLSQEEFNVMLNMINRRFDTRIEKYKTGEKLWEYTAGAVLAISGVKLQEAGIK